jgi:O-methyltransferase domain
VADHLAQAPRPVEELAAAVGADAPSLLRVLRALASRGVFAEPRPGYFDLTPVGDLLRDDHPISMRNAFRLFPDAEAFAALDYSIRTGRVSFDQVHREGLSEHLAAHSEFHAEFHASEDALARLAAVAMLRLDDWLSLRTVVTVGAGDGSPLDTSVPPGADVYLLKRVLGGLDDRQVVTFLRAVRTAMRADSRLLVLEPIADAGGDVSTAMDLLTLVLGNGRVRMHAELDRLLAEAGLQLTRVIATPMIPLVEARPA